MRKKGLLELGRRLIPEPAKEYISDDGSYNRVREDGLNFKMYEACGAMPTLADRIVWEWDGKGDICEAFARWAGLRGHPELIGEWVPAFGEFEGRYQAYRLTWVKERVENRDAESSPEHVYGFAVPSNDYIKVCPWDPASNFEVCVEISRSGAKALEEATHVRTLLRVLEEPEIIEMFSQVAEPTPSA